MPRRLLVLIVATVAIVFLYTWRLGARSFWEPDEPRYAEIGREMLESGDWIVPRLNFVKYYEKPPLTYWVTAASFALLGVGEAQARVGPVLATFVLFAATFVLGRVFYGVREGALGAVLVALFPITWGAGRLLITDMYLSAGIAWGLAGYALALRSREAGRGPGPAMALSGAGLAAAVLAKGPIAIVLFLFGIVPLKVLAGWNGAAGARRWMAALLGWPRALVAEVGARSWAGAAALLIALASPWFVLMTMRDRAFAWFFFVHEHLLRYATPEAHREEVPWYYLAVLFVGLFPASVLVPWAVWRTWPGRRPSGAADRGTVLLGAFAILTILFFTVSHSKLASYVLPVLPAFALVLARALVLELWPGTDSLRSRVALRASLAVAATLAAVGAAAVLLASQRIELPHGISRAAPGLAALLLILAVSLVWGAVRSAARALRVALAAAAVSIVVVLCGVELCSERLDALQSVKTAATFVASKSQPEDVVASYGTLLQGLTFYSGRRTLVVGGAGELSFGASLEPTREWFPGKAEIHRLAVEKRLWIVTPTKLENEVIRSSGGRLRTVLEGPRFTVLTNVP